jgi:hypothetical protein
MGLLLVAGALVATAVALWYLPRNSRRLWKFTARFAAIVLVAASVLPLLAFLFSSAMCGRYEFPPISSRDGTLAAEVSEEDCGAVDSFHSSVNLWQRREGFFAHVFGKRAHSTTVFTVGHDPRLIDISWKDNRTLRIRYPSDFRNPSELSCQSEWEGIQIECVVYAPDYSKPVGKMPPVQRGLW